MKADKFDFILAMGIAFIIMGTIAFLILNIVATQNEVPIIEFFFSGIVSGVGLALIPLWAVFQTKMVRKNGKK